MEIPDGLQKAQQKRIGGPSWGGPDYCCSTETFPGPVLFCENTWLILHASEGAAGPSPSYVKIEAYRVTGFEADGLVDADNTELLFATEIKWDACCNTLFEPGYLHTCDGLRSIADALQKSEAWARSLLKVDAPENEYMADNWPALPKKLNYAQVAA